MSDSATVSAAPPPAHNLPPPPPQILFAREHVKQVRIAPKQVAYLVEEARRGAVQVGRFGIFLGRCSFIHDMAAAAAALPAARWARWVGRGCVLRGRSMYHPPRPGPGEKG